jgi:hypothetical protein
MKRVSLIFCGFMTFFIVTAPIVDAALYEYNIAYIIVRHSATSGINVDVGYYYEINLDSSQVTTTVYDYSQPFNFNQSGPITWKLFSDQGVLLYSGVGVYFFLGMPNEEAYFYGNGLNLFIEDGRTYDGLRPGALGVEEFPGSFYENSNFFELTSVSVPEPSAILLIGFGLAGLAVARKKFKR